MSNIQNIDISLQEIVKNISKNTYLIPKFQRDFVWTTKDITDLGDSIIRGYPISSLLTMPENGTLKVGSHDLLREDFNTYSTHDENQSRYYILDGQQRMTSIAKLFLSADNKNEYYFDLLAILVEKYPDDDIKNDAGIKKCCMLSSTTEDFCRFFPLTKDRSEKPTRQNNRFISGKSIVDNKFGSVVSKFLRVLTDASEYNIDKYTDHLNAILGSVGGYSVPATVIASDSELGVVIRVFEKVNSTGKKLTLFDLINAKSFQVENELYKGGLSDYLEKQINTLIENNYYLRAGANEFLKYDEGKDRFEKLDRIIRIIEITYLLKKNSTPGIFQSVMLMREPEFWFNKWNEEGKKILEIMSWMTSEGLLDIGQITFLEYATAIFLANPKSFDLQRFKTEIKKYALYLTLSGTGFSKSNLDMVEKIYSISKQMTDNHESIKYEYDSPSGNPSLNLTRGQVLGFTTSKMAFKAIMNIFYIDKVDGLFTVDIAGNPIRAIDKTKMDNHHIFPKTRVSNFSAKSKFNSIANIVLVDSNLNRENFKDKLPKDYFKYTSSQEKVPHFCEQNLINIEELKDVDSEESARVLINSRAEKIANIVNSYFK
jgi:uncharacterized protein with ParB-like and HNH nuclease domain